MSEENQIQPEARGIARGAVVWSILTVIGLLSSCAVGPNYNPPELEVPDVWTRAVEADCSAKAGKMSIEQWWGDFADPVLEGLIADMRVASPNLKVALYRIDEAWAQREVHRAGWLPHSDFSGRLDEGLGDFDSDGVRFYDTKSRGEYAAVDVGWEVDLFGVRMRKIEASKAQHERAVEGWRDSLVFLTGEVALRYIDLRSAEAEAQLRRETAGAYRRIFELMEGREKEGLSSKVEVGEALAKLRAEEAKIPNLQKRGRIAKNEIARLCGGYPGDRDEVLKRLAPIPVPSSRFDLAIPADVLRSRPDVRAAERAVAREVAGLGVEIGNFYPKFSLSGALTYELLVSGGGTEVLRRTIGGGGGIVQRLFHGGADRARVFEQKSIVQQVASEYEEAVQRSIADVENALVSLHYGRKEYEALVEAEEAAASALGSLEDAFSDGLIDLRDLLRAQNELSEVRLERIFSLSSQARAGVRLFKAVGGGELPDPPQHIKGKRIRSPDMRVGGRRLPWWKNGSYDVYDDFEG